MQKTQKTTKEVDVNKVVSSLLGTISDLQFRIAVLEAELESALDSSGGGEEGATGQVGKHNDDAKTKRSD
jgi:hypothetical protein